MSEGIDDRNGPTSRRRPVPAPMPQWSDPPAAPGGVPPGALSPRAGAPLFLAPDVGSGTPPAAKPRTEQPGHVVQADRGGREEGTVARFHRQRGFGFITADTDRAEVFVHFQDLLDLPDVNGWRSLVPGQRVSYDRVPGSGRDRARRVRRHS